jgi:hypothetical protein
MICMQILSGGQLLSSYTPHLPGRFALLPYKDRINGPMFKSSSVFTSNLIGTIFRTQIGLASKDSKSPVTILERSLYSERYCFVQVHRLL